MCLLRLAKDYGITVFTIGGLAEHAVHAMLFYAASSSSQCTGTLHQSHQSRARVHTARPQDHGLWHGAHKTNTPCPMHLSTHLQAT